MHGWFSSRGTINKSLVTWISVCSAIGKPDVLGHTKYNMLSFWQAYWANCQQLNEFFGEFVLICFCLRYLQTFWLYWVFQTFFLTSLFLKYGLSGGESGCPIDTEQYWQKRDFLQITTSSGLLWFEVMASFKSFFLLWIKNFGMTCNFNSFVLKECYFTKSHIKSNCLRVQQKKYMFRFLSDVEREKKAKKGKLKFFFSTKQFFTNFFKTRLK